MVPDSKKVSCGPALILWLTILPVLTSCELRQDLPPIEHSPGFFADFDRMVDDAMASGSEEAQAARLRMSYAKLLGEGAGEQETYAVGPTWDKIATFLEVGLRTADVMSDVEGAAPNRVAIYSAASDRVLRSDLVAIEAWNQQVRGMGRAEATLEPTGDLAWASLDLVLASSEQAVVQRWLESGEWIEGYYERSQGHYEEVWVPGYYEPVWQEGSCWEVYTGTECDTTWVDEYCYDEYVDDGYWESSCNEYDEWGDCVSWTDYWVDQGYWVSDCDPGYFIEECWDLYDLVCEDGQWVDLWVEGYSTRGPWIPGETYWVEGHWEDTSGYRAVVLVEEEARILVEGVSIVLDHGPEILGIECYEGLERALSRTSDLPMVDVGGALREAIWECLTEDSPQ